MTAQTRLVTRPAGSGEAEWMMRLPPHLAFFYITYMEDFLESEELIFMLDNTGKEIGLAALGYRAVSEAQESEEQAILYAVYVSMHHFGCGIEAVCLRAAIERCYERGYQRIRFTPRTTDIRAAIAELPSEYRQCLMIHDTGINHDGLLGQRYEALPRVRQ